ncbi:MAG: DUF4956 domain-containing protein [Candidatus Enterenecus sp.]
MLSSVIDSQITVPVFALCTAVSLALGLGCALLCMFRSRYTQSFVVTLAMLPAAVQVVIMLVNGNIGAGVAVAGAFSLVRFRSAPGTAREIGMIFLAMAVGLATGMGYVVLALLFFLVMALFMLALSALRFGGGSEHERELKITIPETLDYDGLFDDLFQKYTRSAHLERVKTSNMGTLYELQYRVVLKSEPIPKEFLDELRCRNGNLNIVCGRVSSKEAL